MRVCKFSEIRVVIATLLYFLVTLPAVASDNVLHRANRLEPMVIDALNGFSVKSFSIESGKFYRWRIESDGRDEYRLMAPELFASSWIQKISIDDKDVVAQGLQSINFDSEGEIDIFFVPMQVGRFPFYVEHLRSQGFEGEFVVE